MFSTYYVKKNISEGWKAMRGFTTHEVMAYSAYYDVRDSHKPIIRVIGVTRWKDPEKVICRMYYKYGTGTSGGKYNNNISLLLGYNKDEGILHTGNAYKDPSLIKKWKSKWNDKFGPSTLLGLKDQPINKKSKDIVKKITNHYIGSVNDLTFDNLEKMTKVYTDAWFGHPIHEFVSRRVENKGKIFYQNSTFQYLFTHQGQFSLSLFLGQGGPYGVAHGDELFYMFSPFSNQTIPLNEEDQKMSQIILSLWKTFIKTGEPSTDKISWDPILDSKSRKYLNLNLNSSMEYSTEIKSNMKFEVSHFQTEAEVSFQFSTQI